MERAARYAPWLVAVLAVGYIMGTMRPAAAARDVSSKNPRDRMHLAAFGRLVVLDEGRYKPIDTVARHHLMQMGWRQEYKDPDGYNQPAVRWFLSLCASGMIDLQLEMPIEDDVARLLDPDPRAQLRNARDIVEVAEERAADIGEIRKKQNKNELELKLLRALDQAEDLVGQARLMEKGLGDKDNSEAQAVIRIDFDQILNMLKLERREGFRFSMREIVNAGTKGDRRPFADFYRKAMNAKLRADEKKPLDVVEQRSLDLMRQMHTHRALSQLQGVAMVPPADFDPEGWKTLRQAFTDGDQKKNSAARHLHTILSAYASGNVERFNDEVAAYAGYLKDNLPQETRKAGSEAWFNQLAPFYRCAFLYVACFILAVASWLVWEKPLRESAFALLLVTVVLHSFALYYRMELTGRPPVANLYGSAVFIGWGCVLVCLFMDWRIYWNGIPTAMGALLGFGTMVIAHYLGGSGDTMAVLQAVLDTNFWLATHVTIVTLGYTATFVAGFLATAYLYRMLASSVLAFFRNRGNPAWSSGVCFALSILGVALVPACILVGVYWGLLYLIIDDNPFTHSLGMPLAAAILLFGLAYSIMVGMRFMAPSPEDRPGEIPESVRWMEKLELNQNSSKALSNEVYGVVCFAVLLSFVGTVLGGIWADQSWGRFWGWDPKENGAILVVIINALILHARWGGMIKERGLVVLALCGNMVTMWSWFGTNQLGIGLHSYGFNKALISMCSWFWISQILLIGLAMLPGQYWKAYAARPEAKPAKPGKAHAGAIRQGRDPGVQPA